MDFFKIFRKKDNKLLSGEEIAYQEAKRIFHNVYKPRNNGEITLDNLQSRILLCNGAIKTLKQEYDLLEDEFKIRGFSNEVITDPYLIRQGENIEKREDLKLKMHGLYQLLGQFEADYVKIFRVILNDLIENENPESPLKISDVVNLDRINDYNYCRLKEEALYYKLRLFISRKEVKNIDLIIPLKA